MIFAFLFVNFDVGKEDLTLNLNLEDEEQKNERTKERNFESVYPFTPSFSRVSVYPFDLLLLPLSPQMCRASGFERHFV